VRGRVGEPELLSDLVIRPDDGSVWVCVETSPGGLRRYDRQGNLLRSVDGLPALDDLAYDAARDRLWALAIDERVLYRFDGEGDRVDSLSLAAMAFPRGLALDPTDGTVWVIDRAGELYPRGPDAPSTAPRSDGSTFYDAAVDPQGEGIWVTDPANRAVYFFERTVSAWPQFPWVGLGVPREIAARSHSGSLVEAWATDDAGAVAILESRSGVVTRLAGIGSPRGLFVGDEDDAWLFEGTTGALVHVDRQATGATRLVRLPSPRKVAVRTR
jgi:hypothetical protein